MDKTIGDDPRAKLDINLIDLTATEIGVTDRTTLSESSTSEVGKREDKQICRRSQKIARILECRNASVGGCKSAATKDDKECEGKLKAEDSPTEISAERSKRGNFEKGTQNHKEEI